MKSNFNINYQLEDLKYKYLIKGNVLYRLIINFISNFIFNNK
jgi:hypothetical protein